MDPSNQLFGQYLRYRMDMQKSMAEQQNGQPEVKKVAAIGVEVSELRTQEQTKYTFLAHPPILSLPGYRNQSLQSV